MWAALMEDQDVTRWPLNPKALNPKLVALMEDLRGQNPKP